MTTADSETVTCPRCGNAVLAYFCSDPVTSTSDVHAHGIWTGKKMVLRDITDSDGRVSRDD